MGFWDTVGHFSWNPGGIFDKKGGDVGGGAPSIEDLLGLIDKYSYKPQMTGQTETGLYDLFTRLTGEGGQGVEGIPFDIGLPTTGLYDSLTRGIKQDYLGTPGGPEGGRIADMRAYYNNMGIPEYAGNQERLANNDLNALLTDAAAQINESQKNRLLQTVGLGSQVGSSLYGQNLGQHRANAGFALNAAGLDIATQNAIQQANQASLDSLFSGIGSIVGKKNATGSGAGSGLGALLGTTAFGPIGGIFGGVAGGYLGGKAGQQTAKLVK